MRRLSPAGRRIIAELADRHGFSEDAVASMAESIQHGNGCTAQFSHPEFGGCGHWTRGAAARLADVFNHSLSARVEALCGELSDVLSSQPELLRRGDVQARPQAQQQAAIAGGASVQAGGSEAGSRQYGGRALPPAGGHVRPAPDSATTGAEDVFAKIERLAALRARGFVSEEEFAAKKAELLARL